MRTFLSVLVLLLAVSPVWAGHAVLYNTQNSFVIPWPATDRTDFKTAETALTPATFVVKAYKRNRAPVTVTIATCVFATSTLTSTGTNPANNDTFTIAGTLNGTAVSEVKTFKTTLTGAANEVKIAASAALTLDNVLCAINDAGCAEGTDYGTGTVASQLVNATTNGATTQVIVANITGTGPNAYTTAEVSSQLSWTGSTLASGNAPCMSHESAGRHWFAGDSTLFDTLGPMTLTFNYDAEALPFEFLLDVLSQSSFDARYVSVASTDDQAEIDCSTIANTNSPDYKSCNNLNGSVTTYSPWRNPTTIATLASQTSFTLAEGSTDDNAYKDWMILVTDASTALQMARGVVSAYTGSTKTVTLRTDPGVFAMAVGDSVLLAPDASLKPTVDFRPVTVSSAGVADANVTQYGGSAGTFASGRPEVNASHFGGSAGTFASGRPEVNASHFGGTAGTFASGRPEVNTTHAAGTAWGSGAITAGVFASDSFTAAKFASDVSTEFSATLMATTFEGAHTFKHFLQYGASSLFGKYNSASGTFNFRDLADSKNRVIYVTTSTGRTTVTLSPD